MITEDPRFAGIGRLYGTEALARLAGSHVVVVGIGGVGSWVAEALARTGMGRISLIDMDEVCVSNVNRQLHALDGQVGKPKVEVMAERLRAISPSCEVRAVMDFVTPNNLAELITDDISCVVDCIDSVNAKVALIAWCRRRKIPVITTGGAGGQIDPTQITVADLSKTVNDPLAAKARSLLRRDHNFPRADSKRSFGVPCVYSKEQLRYPKPDGSVCTQKSFVGEGVRLDCSGGFGAVTMVTATFGMVAAAQAVQRLLRRP
ncbi:MAG TPA: tRNA cyclic N6-threonylcarbamoyladenosine(37) synthase TcdA [Pseudomonas sp.]|nr:tRNA cyclic N6-threonylcarbamoyladenosine(37) synthase TcdA [Pseudomonas sp.]HCA24158.1 tRNA cyclic N6-threonylcarbamoyladenosine(37) synthase TcdA [Pseudomonas sp.]|tara:strand:+ start:15 stop:797 length:783 start_codon:yes stop_codon:yes gene_type:complete